MFEKKSTTCSFENSAILSTAQPLTDQQRLYILQELTGLQMEKKSFLSCQKTIKELASINSRIEVLKNALDLNDYKIITDFVTAQKEITALAQKEEIGNFSNIKLIDGSLYNTVLAIHRPETPGLNETGNIYFPEDTV